MRSAAARPAARICLRSWLSTKEFIFKLSQHREKIKLLNPTCSQEERRRREQNCSWERRKGRGWAR